MASKKIIYCDKCAQDKGLPTQRKKHVKSTCQICDRFVGPLNETVEEDIISNDINTDPVEFGSFIVQRENNFLADLNAARIYPNLPYEIKSQDLVIYYPAVSDDAEGRKTLILANPKLGHSIKIILPAQRRSTSVGIVDDMRPETE